MNIMQTGKIQLVKPTGSWKDYSTFDIRLEGEAKPFKFLIPPNDKTPLNAGDVIKYKVSNPKYNTCFLVKDDVQQAELTLKDKIIIAQSCMRGANERWAESTVDDDVIKQTALANWDIVKTIINSK
jgi:hypothetical protein